MRRMSHRCAVCVVSGSTLSVEMATEGMSDRKLLSRICFASRGRNGMNSVATAMLTMLPKFALVVMATYLRVLAKVRRPSTTPWPRTARSRSSSTMSAVSRDVDRLIDRDADVGDVQRRCIVDAVAQECHDMIAVLQRPHDARLLLRIDLGEDLCPLGQVPQGLVAHVVELLAGQQTCGIDADGLAHMRRHIAVVAGDDLE